MKHRPAVLAAVALAVPSGAALLAAPDPWARGGAAVLLGAIGGIYAGFALLGGSLRAKILESIQAVACCAVAVAGLLGSWGWLAAGLAAHAVWDWSHHRSAALARPPSWYPSFCAVYDLVLGAFVLARHLG